MTERNLMEPTKESLILAQALKAMQGVESRVTALEGDMTEVKQQLTEELLISPAQALALRKIANQKIHEVCKDEESYKARRSKLYPSIWRDFQNKFNISQYRELPRIKIDIAVKFLREWAPLNLAA